MSEDSLNVYEPPKARVRVLELESTVLSGNTENPNDPGTEIDI